MKKGRHSKGGTTCALLSQSLELIAKSIQPKVKSPKLKAKSLDNCIDKNPDKTFCYLKEMFQGTPQMHELKALYHESPSSR